MPDSRERLKCAKKFIDEGNYAEAIKILEEIEHSGDYDSQWIRQQKKNIIMLYISSLHNKSLELISQKQYSQGVKLLDKLISLIMHYSNYLGIDKQAIERFLEEFINDIQAIGIEKITLGSEANKNLKEKASNRAKLFFSDNFRISILEILFNCFTLSETYKEYK